MAKRDSFNPDYEALFREDDPGLFDNDEEALKKKLAEVSNPEELGSIDVNEMLKALGGLEEEKGRLKDKRWYADTESPALKKAKYGDIPSQFAEIPEGRETHQMPSDVDALFEPSTESDLSDEEDTGKPKAVSVEKTKVTKAPLKRSMPNVLVGRDTTLDAVRKELEKKKGKKPESKETVKLSADTFEPEEIKLEPGKDDESWKSMLQSLSTPDKGVEEDEVPWMIGGLGGLAKGLGKAAAKGFGKAAVKDAGKSASEGIGRSLVSEAGEASAGKVPRVPSARRMLEDKVRLDKINKAGGPVAVGKMRDSVRAMAQEAGGPESMMFKDVAGRRTKSPSGVIGRRLELSSGRGADAEGSHLQKILRGSKRTKPLDAPMEKERVTGLKSSVTRMPIGPEDVTDIARSDVNRITQQLANAVKKGTLTRQKYTELLERLGRSQSEIQAELMKAGLK